MSTQTQQPETQQPVVVYPNTVSGQAPPSHSHSNGSFGTVFIVLAVIVVISAIACFLGRLCNRRMSQTKPSKRNQNHTIRPKERDIEFGLDGRNLAAKPPGHGDPSKGFKMPGNGDPRGFRIPEHGDPRGIRMPGNGDPAGFRMPGNGDPTGFRMAGHGDIKGETKPIDDGELKASA
ncbi:hypothetical protein QQP08_006865 [Theobroma cacao]|nr:hypothetical protein QQP08_006106 [Theobroma cacao]WRX14378.1 hypothetical protein QQP08_006865 [Theobroma cacao]